MCLQSIEKAWSIHLFVSGPWPLPITWGLPVGLSHHAPRSAKPVQRPETLCNSRKLFPWDPFQFLPCRICEHRNTTLAVVPDVSKAAEGDKQSWPHISPSAKHHAETLQIYPLDVWISLTESQNSKLTRFSDFALIIIEFKNWEEFIIKN